MERHCRAIGIDIGGTNLRGALVAPDGTIEERVAERIARSPTGVVAQVIDVIHRIDRRDVSAIGIGIPGRVDTRRQTILSGGYVDLSAERLADSVAAAIGRPVTIDNDANMALAAEIAVGAAQGCENVVMFTIGTGIGGAVFLEGRMIRGRMTAGQLGHLTVDLNGLPCACGRQGCVETTSSGTALARLIAAAQMPSDTRIEDLFRRDVAGDAAATAVLLRWARPLRAAIDTAVAAFAPDLVMLGGALGQAAHRALVKAPPSAEWYRCPVQSAALGDDAGVIGAGLSAIAQIQRDVSAACDAGAQGPGPAEPERA